MYFDVMGTVCSSNDLNMYITKLGNDKISKTFEPVMWEIYNSSYARALSNVEYVNRIYMGLLGRSPTAIERYNKVALINAKNRREVLDDILNSKEWKERAKTLGLKI